MTRLKRWLVILHLYAGLALCLLFVAWFVSGIAMVYYRTPVLDEAQRLAFAPRLDRVEPIRVAATIAPLAARWSDVETLRLARSGERALYRWRTANDGWRAAWADSGAPAGFDAATLTPEAQRWFGGATSHYVGSFEAESQWSYFSALRAHYPLHKFASSNGPFADEVLFSSRTGEPVVATTAGSRLLYYLGPGLHYVSLYPIRNNDPLWRAIVNWSSGIGAAAALLGIVVGLWQLRWRALRSERRAIPYARRWMRWHHWSGLAFGLPAFTFVLSGLFSMNPGSIFPSSRVAADVERAWQGERSGIERLPAPALVVAALPGQTTPRELEWRRLRGEDFVLAVERPGVQTLLRHDGMAWRPGPGFDERELVRAVAGAQAAAIRRVDRLDAFDDFYYARKDRPLPLPVLRVHLDDTAATWLHIDPATARLLAKGDEGTRLRRWVYNGLHSFDFQFLLRREALWQGVIWTLSLAGLALSVTSTVIAWHWLRRRLAPGRRSPASPADASAA